MCGVPTPSWLVTTVDDVDSRTDARSTAATEPTVALLRHEHVDAAFLPQSMPIPASRDVNSLGFSVVESTFVVTCENDDGEKTHERLVEYDTHYDVPGDVVGYDDGIDVS